MAFIDVLIFLVLLAILIGGTLYAYNNSRRKAVIAQAPPGAQVDPDDNLQTALAKSRNHHRVIEAVRIFNEISHQDSAVPMLNEQTRRDVDAFLADYYKHN